jgi:hypothetical protein
MATQFSTEAANADVMGEDAQTPGVPAGMPHAIGADGTPRDRSDRTPETKGGGAKADEPKAGKPKEGEAKPRKDEDASKP